MNSFTDLLEQWLELRERSKDHECGYYCRYGNDCDRQRFWRIGDKLDKLVEGVKE